MTRVSLAFGSILVVVLCSALALGFVPDREGAVRQGRKELTEALAVSCTLAVQRGDMAALDAAVRLICQRNPEIVSAAVRKADGKALIQWGDPDASGQATDGESRMV